MTDNQPTKRLKVMCGPCHHITGYVWEDARGALTLTSKDRLQEFRAGQWWTDEDAVLIDDETAYLYSGCTKGKPGCGQSYSWQLLDARAELGKARGTGRVVTYTL